MRNFILHLLFFCPLLLLGQIPPNDSHWQLVWDDDFNFKDVNKWDIYDWAIGNEITIFLDDNVAFSNGNLEITTQNIPIYCPPNPPANWGARPICEIGYYPYSSGWISSDESFSTQYGYIEANIKLSYGYGYWPAFWTFVRENYSNNSNAAEIDIFEMLGHLPPNTVTTNIHREYCNQNHPQFPLCSYLDKLYYNEAYLSNFNYTDWHTYAIEWSPDKIIWYVDGRVIRNLPNHGIIDPVRIIFSAGIDPSHLPNFATTFPLKMWVDYVKVYDLNTDCNNLINDCSYDFVTYDNQVKNSITIGDGGCSNTVATGSNVTIRASEFIELKGDFTVPLGANFYADANKNCSNTLATECTNIYNRCNYNFSDYDNAIKKEILLGGSGCNVPINPSNGTILLQATDKITLKSGVTITPQAGNLVELSIVNCP